MLPAELTPHTLVRDPAEIRTSPPLICFQSAILRLLVRSGTLHTDAAPRERFGISTHRNHTHDFCPESCVCGSGAQAATGPTPRPGPPTRREPGSPVWVTYVRRIDGCPRLPEALRECLDEIGLRDLERETV
ncbi:hypothetical protein EASAB2608_00560 [Streptomyces sp. EAS-AB2608]|uniref:Uncharacterized protein n=1 Tax=Streptomyces bangladeshensis TaxID=295352 RepID=A0ABN3C165_9ACTN|nr:hypothetical protein EASAB2608_00560 [Streptomyces sp. EAS-AB2608]